MTVSTQIGIWFSGVSIIAGSLLLIAGSYKVLFPTGVSQTIADLSGIRLRRLYAGRVLGGLELVSAFVLVLEGEAVAFIAVSTLGLGFAIAGIMGIRGTEVSCHCFRGSTASLGLRHVAGGMAYVAVGFGCLALGTKVSGLGGRGALCALMCLLSWCIAYGDLIRTRVRSTDKSGFAT